MLGSRVFRHGVLRDAALPLLVRAAGATGGSAHLVHDGRGVVRLDRIGSLGAGEPVPGERSRERIAAHAARAAVALGDSVTGGGEPERGRAGAVDQRAAHVPGHEPLLRGTDADHSCQMKFVSIEAMRFSPKPSESLVDRSMYDRSTSAPPRDLVPVLRQLRVVEVQ
ncbi:hypothetical protein [Lentzea sp. NPDC060358]|uniref:hypothetical protein n=1 Tax=Lentzea sp. NPDC060358 TaxID=3347103 RepID=UPI0036602AA1